MGIRVGKNGRGGRTGSLGGQSEGKDKPGADIVNATSRSGRS